MSKAWCWVGIHSWLYGYLGDEQDDIWWGRECMRCGKEQLLELVQRAAQGG